MRIVNLFRQINKVVNDTTNIGATSLFRTTAPFLLKQAQSPNNAAIANGSGATPTARVTPVAGSRNQQGMATARLPTYYPNDRGLWNRLSSKFLGYTPTEDDQFANSRIPANPDKLFDSPTNIRNAFLHIGVNSPYYYDYDVATSLSPLTPDGRPVTEDPKRPIAHSFSDKRTRYRITDLEPETAYNPLHGLTSKEAFVDVITQAENAYNRAKNNYMNIIKKQNVTDKDIKRAEMYLQKAQNYYGSLLHSYQSLLSRPYGHNYTLERDYRGRPLRIFGESGIFPNNYPAASHAFNLLQTSPEVKYYLSNKLAQFYNDSLGLYNDYFAAGYPVPVGSYASTIYALANSNFYPLNIQNGDFLIPPEPTKGTEKERENYRRFLEEMNKYRDTFTLKSDKQPVNPKGELLRIPGRPATSDISSLYTLDAPVGYAITPLHEGEEAVAVAPNGYTYFGLPDTVPARFPTPENVKGFPTEIQIAPQIYRELPPIKGQGTENQYQAGDMIRNTLKQSLTQELTKLSLLASAGLLRENEYYAIPLNGNSNSPLYMKAQYVVPVKPEGAINDDVNKRPAPHLKPEVTTTIDGKVMPQVYAFTHTFKPTEKGIDTASEEKPLDEKQVAKLSAGLVEANTANVLDHFLRVIGSQLKDGSIIPKYRNYLFERYKNTNLNTPESIANFLQNELYGGKDPVDDDLRKNIIGNFSAVIVDPRTGKHYLNMNP
jgi:hypothetical protein